MNTKNEHNNGLVSVILPVYNAGLFLNRCIESVKRQVYTNWELLIVDDGSEDNSRDIIEKYRKEDERIILICNEHGGTARARNTAIEVAKGDYLAFIDADDVYHPRFIEILIEAICSEQVDIAICGIAQGINSKELATFEIGNSFKVINKNEAFSRMYGGEWLLMISPWNKLYSKKLFDDIRFPSGRYFEDAATINLVIYNCKKISITEDKLYYYYVTPNSSSKTKRSEELLDREWALRSHWEFFLRQNRKDLAYQAIPFYLLELIIIYFKIEASDRPEDCKLIRKLFKKTYKKFRRKISFSDTQKDTVLAFYYLSVFDIKKMIQQDGLIETAKGFIRKIIK